MATDHGSRTTDQLERVLGPWTAAAIVIGTVIGSGVFKKPAVVAADVPTFGVAIAAWTLMALLVLFGALALAEVAVLFPRTGGNYVFLREGYGRAFGFMWGWMDFFVIRTASIAALATIFTESLHDVLRHSSADPKVGVFGFWTLHAIAQATILWLGIVNALGVRWGAGLQFFLTMIKVGGIILMILLPVGIIRLAEGAPTPTLGNLQPLWSNPNKPFDLIIFGGVLIHVLWPYHGWMNLGPVAGEVRHPQRNIPLALLTGIGVVTLLYLGLNVAFASAIPFDEMAALKDTGTSVAAAFCNKLLGPVGAVVAASVVMCSVFGALNGNMLVGPRLLFAMGEDRLAPAGLSAVHPRYRTPARAIMTYTLWSMTILFIGGLTVDLLRRSGRIPPDPFDLLTNFAMFGAVVFETLAVAAIFVFRRTLPAAPRPYRCPGYPVVPAIYVLAFMGVLASYFANEDKRIEAYSGTAFVLAGAAVYALFLRGRRND